MSKLYNVYRFPSGFQTEAGYIFKHLINEGFKPEWDFVKGETLIYLDKNSTKSLIKLSELNPRVWGNASEIKKHMKKTININPVKRYGSRAKFKHKRLVSPKKFAKKSFRVIHRGGKEIVVACPKGKYSKRTKKCKVGMRAQAVLTLKKNPKEILYKHLSKTSTKYDNLKEWKDDVKKLDYSFRIWEYPGNEKKYIAFDKSGYNQGEYFPEKSYGILYSYSKKNPKETLYFIYAKRGGMSGLYTGKFTLTDQLPDALHYHNKKFADETKEKLQRKFPKWIWSVKPINFFEG